MVQFYKLYSQRDPSLIFKAKDFTTIKQENLLEFLIKNGHSLKPIKVWDKLMEWSIAQSNELPSNITKWTADNVSTFGKIIQPFIPHINFKQITPSDFFQKIKPFKEIFNNEFYVKILEYYSFNSDLHSKFKMNIDSKIIDSEQAFILFNLFKFIEDNGCNLFSTFFYNYELLVRGSRDGFKVGTFHECCDGKGPTITIARIKNTNEILGGYNPNSWESKGGRSKTEESFIFSLDQNNLKNSIYSRIISEKCAHYNDKSFGPNFGGYSSSDLKLLCSNTNKGICKRNEYHKQIRNSEEEFEIEEYEVFRVCHKTYSRSFLYDVFNKNNIII